jgi:CHAD domain-containing protein
MLLDYVKLKDIKPALYGYIRESKSMLALSAIADEKVVHDVRVLMKKSRASMRLIRTQMDVESYSREYLTFREVGRKMRSWRETSVHRKILKEFKKKYPDIISRLEDNEKIGILMKKPESHQDTPTEIKEYLPQISDLLNKSGYRIRFQSMNNLDPKLLLKELEKTYIQVTDCYITARNNPKTTNLHVFRKRAKDFLYQLYFFRPLKPPVIKALEKKLDTLTQNLGRCNDLAVLVNELGYKYSVTDNSPAMDELIIVIRGEQDKYLSKVWPIAYKVFCPGQNLMNVLGFKLLVI